MLPHAASRSSRSGFGVRFRSTASLGLLALAAALPEPALSQVPCDAWLRGFGAPGPDRPFLDFQTFDDGSGPALYACGGFRSIGDESMQGVVRWHGATWSQVGTGLGDVLELAAFDDGTGARLHAASPADGVVRWDGGQWSALPGLSIASARDVLGFDDGSGPALYVAGVMTVAGVGGAVPLARWRNGTWTRVDAGLPAGLSTNVLAVFDAGGGPALYLGTRSSGAALWKWNGTNWTNAAPAFADASVEGLAVYAGGGTSALYVAGKSLGAASIAWHGLGRFDGVNVAPIAPALTDIHGEVVVRGISVHDFGAGSQLVVAGDFDGAGMLRSRGILGWDGSVWHAVGPAPGLSWFQSSVALASFDDGSGRALFVSGECTLFGGTVAAWAAKHRNGAWSALARGDGLTPFGPGTMIGGPNMALRSTVLGGAPTLVASGRFVAAGGTEAPGIALYDGASWRGLHGPGSVGARFLASTEIDLGSGPELVAGGSYSTVLGSSVARWNGVDWSPIGNLGGAEVRTLAAFDDGSGMALFAGLSGSPDVQRWNGSTWSAAVSLGSGEVFDLRVHDDGSGPALFACGDFVVAEGGSSRRGIARWNGVNWAPVGADTFSSAGGASMRLASLDLGSGPELYLAGTIALANPPAGAALARWDGSTWTPVPTPGSVRDVAVFHDGTAPRLCIAMTSATAPTWRVAKQVGTAWITLGSVDGEPQGLAAHDGDGDGVPELFVGGSFRAVDGVPAANIARFAGCGTQGEIVCAGDGTTSACPCANSGASGHGCANSVHPGGALLASGGLASLAYDTLRLEARGLTGSFALFAQGTSSVGTGVPFGDGLSCVDGTVLRLARAPIASDAARIPAAGGAPLSQLGSIAGPGSTRVYQVVYRNQASFCTPGAENATNGLRLTWSP